MSDQRDNVRTRKNEHTLKHLPAEVLLKARSTLVSLSGALKPKQEQQKSNKKLKTEKLKNSKSEPEFNNGHSSRRRSRLEEKPRGEFGVRPRPVSVGCTKRREYCDIDPGYRYGYSNDSVNNRYGSSEEILQSRLLIPVNGERTAHCEVQFHENNERPRKKLSFREPEITNGFGGTLGRSSKYMGVNSLSRRAQRYSLPPEKHSSSFERLDSDLEVRIISNITAIIKVLLFMKFHNGLRKLFTLSK